jgi:4-aminobutyrate aminotransferase-like enzyme
MSKSNLIATAIPQRSPEEIITLRRRHLNPTLSLSYKEPIKMVRGAGAYLYDERGNAYLDMVNNVCHVGHCHPTVVAAGQAQMAQLNTNTRYLHDNIVEYAQRLTATFPAELSVVFLTNSGTEANDLALRIAQTYTNARDLVVVDHAYHGNSPTMIELSPYKFNGKGGRGKPAHVQVATIPDAYRGAYRKGTPHCGELYAQDVQRAISSIQQQGKKLAAFYCESILGCGGQVVLPSDYLKHAYTHIRAAGGVCVADEVQVGFGRVGTHFWAFEQQGVVPDIVTMGKPIGNGHPMGAVVTRPEIAHAFITGMEYFNTFAGNPVSCAIGLAVLDVIREEKLQENAGQVGAFLLKGIREIQSRFPIIGDVRGAGLFIGIELVKDTATLAPATQAANTIVELMKQQHILLSTDGPFDNVIKIKPPLVFSQENAEEFLEKFERSLGKI